MPQKFQKKNLSQKLGFRTPDFFKRQKKFKAQKTFVKRTSFRGAQHRG